MVGSKEERVYTVQYVENAACNVGIQSRKNSCPFQAYCTTCRLNFFVEKSSVTEIWVKLAIFSWKISSCEFHTLLGLLSAHL